MQIIFLLVVELGAGQQLQGAQYAIQRRAYFMAHGRQKQGFRGIRCVGRLPGLFQGGFNLLARTDITEGAKQHVLASIAGRRAAEVKVAAVEGLEVVAMPGRSAIERLADPAGAQRFALQAVTQPMLGQGVFQHNLAVGATQHAQGDRRGLDHIATEGLAFNQCLNPVDRGDDEALVDPAHHQPDQRHTEQAKHQRTEQFAPQSADHIPQVDRVHQLPVRRLELLANDQMIRQQATADKTEKVRTLGLEQ